MARLILALLVLAMAMAVLKMAIAVLLIAGLVFRTGVTVSLLAILAAFALLEAYPAATVGGVAVIGLVTAVRAARRRATPEGRERLRLEHAIEDPEQE